MIVLFKIKNFRSILEIDVDFSYAEGKAPNGYENLDFFPFFSANSKERMIPCLALFGANASGKTNIILAMTVFRNAALRKTIDYYEPNKLNHKFSSTSFEICFYYDNNKYAYFIEYNAVEILAERLLVNGEEIYCISRNQGSFRNVRTENYLDEKLQNILNVECSDGNNHQIFTFISKIGANYKGLNKYIIAAYNWLNKKVMTVSDNDIPLPVALEGLKKFYNDDPKEALTAITELVRRLDIDVRDIVMTAEQLVSSEYPENVIFRRLNEKDHYEVTRINFLHEDDNKIMVPLDLIREESDGTRRLAGLIGVLLLALKEGQVCFVDELDCSLHSLLLRELIRIFKDKNYNIQKAQLVFTTHNTDILDDDILRISEVAIVRKNLVNGTKIKRIADFRDERHTKIRNVTNFRKQYLSGFYSGIPHPAI